MKREQRRSEPVSPILENFYDIKQAPVRLGIRSVDDPTQSGERWLRNGFNRPADGSKGRPFPGRYLGKKLMFSESDLAVIAQIAQEEAEARRRSRPSRGRRRSTMRR
ncbi:hypothetical protein [Streptomyces sp. UG1]|uniref:hypothetical protein n=1 Tax=Streptomyces sp. UG1 TaxID=3417652 RepID=UPI003CF67886